MKLGYMIIYVPNVTESLASHELGTMNLLLGFISASKSN
jgi:hypothetical protein